MNNKYKDITRRSFLGTVSAGLAFAPVRGNLSYTKENLTNSQIQNRLMISTFDIDATPPVGSYLAYDIMENSWNLGLRAKGIVLTGAGKPIVMCVIDWIGIANESQDVFKVALAEAVNTDPQRVVVHTLHQHDAPRCDFSAEKALIEAGVNPQSYDSNFAREFLGKLKKTVKDSLNHLQLATHIGYGKAPVYQVASNRRLLGKDGLVKFTRYTSCPDPVMRAEPEGTIDPMVSLVSFWNDQKPVAVLSYYAVHPQSYYRTGTANPDFPGIARFYRQLAVPDALHVHFNGAGGNIGAGKYNDGDHKNRDILARRLADGMERAWKNTKKTPVFAEDIHWATEPVLLPLANDMIPKIENQIKETKSFDNMSKLIWLKQRQSGKAIDIACLYIDKIRVLFMPGELFVEYQLAAKSLRPDLFVCMAAYGEYGPSYIGTKESYKQGGYEIDVSPVTPEVEDILMKAIRKLLQR